MSRNAFSVHMHALINVADIDYSKSLKTIITTGICASDDKIGDLVASVSTLKSAGGAA